MKLLRITPTGKNRYSSLNLALFMCISNGGAGISISDFGSYRLDGNRKLLTTTMPKLKYL